MPATMLRDRLVAAARNLRQLIVSAEASDPAFAESLKAKSLLGSKSVWFPLVTWGVTALVTHYGLGFDEATMAMLASLLSYMVTVVVRYFTRAPISSVLPQSSSP